MISHVIFNGCADGLKNRLEQYWESKTQRLHKLLVPYRDDLQDLRLTVSCHALTGQRQWYEANGVIHLPTGTLAAEASDKVPHAALDHIADLLAGEIKRHKQLVRRDYMYKRKSHARGEVRAAGPSLPQEAEAGGREEFNRLLQPHMGFLRGHAARELRLLEQEGSLLRREATADDLADEVMTLAWQRFGERPQRRPLVLWLIDLLHETEASWLKQEPRPHVSLEIPADEAEPGDVPPQEIRQEAEEKEWWDDLEAFDQPVQLEEDLIPDSRKPDGGGEAVSAAESERMDRLLSELPAEQREAFLLHAVDEYDLAEIAMLQDRSESDVKADLNAARRTLRERLTSSAPR